MKARLIVAGLGNLVDTVSTLSLIGHGFYELNPVMRWLLRWPAVFAAVKLTVIPAVLLWLWKERESRYAVAASWVGAVFYGGLALYYILWRLCL